MARIKPERVTHAIHNIHNWHLSVNTQASKHLIPLLALLEAGAGNMGEIVFEESDDFAFWDKYFRLDDNEEKPYFHPLTLRRAEKGYPHSNIATIRKQSFFRTWKAASLRIADDKSYWTLSDDYAKTLSEKALRKSKVISRVPILDLSIILFRNEEFPDAATSTTIADRFRERFKMRDEDFVTLFQPQTEDPSATFQPGTAPDVDATAAAIESALVSEDSSVEAAPTTPGDDKISRPDDPVLTQVQQLLALGTSGIILSGPPGTGKSWYARRMAATLVKNPAADIFQTQFHPSYGYEDFVEGYRPDDTMKSGFNIVEKTFLRACRRAKEIAKDKNLVVVIIDEINRGDPARIFGELLTYIENSYRGRTFILPFSGSDYAIPANLLLLGTMNPHDKSITHLDAAFVRRFDHIAIEPSPSVVEEMISKKGFSDQQVELIVDWFNKAQQMLPIGLGHSFFRHATNIDQLKVVWKYRIRPTAEVMLEYEPAMKQNFIQSFQALTDRLDAIVERA